VRSALAWIVAIVLAAAALPAGAQQLASVSATAPGHYVAIEPIARALGWTFRRTADGATLDDGTGPQTLRIGSRMVKDDGLDVQLFDAPAVIRNGKLALAIADAATLFHLRMQQDGGTIALTSDVASGVTIREVPRPATPAPVPAATAQPTPFAAPEAVAATAGSFNASVLFDGSERVFQTNLSSSSGTVRGSVSSYGSDALSTPVGSIVVGPPGRNVALGSIGNPLSGTIIENGSLAGVRALFADGSARYEAFSGNTYDGSLLAVQRTHGNTTDVVSTVSMQGTTQVVLRHAVVNPQAWGTIDDETLVGGRGTAAAIHARTNGATFIDATVSAARGTLPLNEGDLPSGAVIGRHLGPVTTVTAGYVNAIGAPGGPTLGVATHVSNVSVAGNVSAHWTNLTASFGGASAYGSLYASLGAERVVGFNAGAGLHHALAEVNFSSSSGNTATGLAQLRTTHAGINFAAGADLDTGRIHPLVGLVVSVTPTLAFETGLVVGPSGRPALRLSILAGIRAPRPRVAMFPVTVFVPDATHYGPLKLFIDGAPAAAPIADGARVAMPAGRHSLYVVSGDDAYASLAQDVTAGAGASAGAVKLALFAQRTIAGTIRFGGSDGATPAEATLSGIRVVLEPSGQSAVTDAEGRFAFARAPYDPNSTLLIDPASVDGPFEIPLALPIAAGPLDFVLSPARGIERTTFPASNPKRSAQASARTSAA